jgi:hypothetical protein
VQPEAADKDYMWKVNLNLCFCYLFVTAWLSFDTFFELSACFTFSGSCSTNGLKFWAIVAHLTNKLS